jgi:hypothetical protein
VNAPKRLAAIGCRAHTGWAALVVVAGDAAHLEVVVRRRIELADPASAVPRAVYQRSRELRPAEAMERIAAVAQAATGRAAAALENAVQEAGDAGRGVRRCGVVVGNLSADVPLESILASHALAHAAEGRLYQEALLDGAEACGLRPIAVMRASIWDEACWTFEASMDDMKRHLAEVRREVGAPWAEDQKLAALAALLALAAR